MRKAWRIALITFVVLALGLLAAAACDEDEEPTPTYPAEFLAEGQVLFSADCAACHGADAQGTAMGSDIAGKSESSVLKTVRKGEDDEMPAFTIDQISDEELHKIAAFVGSLE